MDLCLPEQNTLKVIAYGIDKKQIIYECPFCFRLGKKITNSLWKKNGTRYKTLKPNYHFHGNDGDMSNRVEKRSSHCMYNESNVEITISDKTIRY